GTLTVHGPKDGVEALVWSPDSRRLAVAGSDGTVGFYDLAKPDPLWSRKLHSKAVRGLAFDPAGRLLVSCGSDGQICLIGPTNPEQPRRLNGEEKEFHLVAFMSNGRELISCGDCYGPEIGCKVPSVNTVALWDVACGKRLRSFRVGDDGPP